MDTLTVRIRENDEPTDRHANVRVVVRVSSPDRSTRCGGGGRGKPATRPRWFMSNANVTTLATGMLGAALGASPTSLAAIVLGVAVGSVSPYSTPRRVRSRVAADDPVRRSIGFRVSRSSARSSCRASSGSPVHQMSAGEILTMATGVEANGPGTSASALALALAIFGYHRIHRTQKWPALLFLLTFGVFTVAALIVVPLDSAQLSFDGFNWPAFLVQFGAAAAYALGWAPYVSDYSRYLPPETRPGKALFHTYGGVFVGAVWLMALGAFIAAVFSPPRVRSDGVSDAADLILPGFGFWTPACRPARTHQRHHGEHLRRGDGDDHDRRLDPPSPTDALGAHHRLHGDRGRRISRCAGQHGRLPGELRQLPRHPALRAGAVDVGQPRGLLLRAPRSLRDPTDLQPREGCTATGDGAGSPPTWSASSP